MSGIDQIEDLDVQIDALETSLGAATGMAANFQMELQRINETFAATRGGAIALERSFSKGLKSAIDGVVLHGDTLSDALRNVGQSLITTAYNAAVQPVANHFGALLAQGLGGIFGPMVPFANGGGFAQGRVMPFANGGIVSSPTLFPMRGGTGLMGEAGPEAIMPLTRGADGKLGVRSEGGGRPVQVVMNIQTQDVEGFRRSQSQVAAQMSRAIARAQRNR